jgi:predicted nucleic acid-binding protein
MKVIVDTSIWSLALRRDGQNENEFVQEFRNLIHDHLVQMLGPIRQEILSGIRHESQFNRLKKRLDSFPDVPILTEDYISAASFFNVCRSKGVQGSNTDFLICAVAVRSKYPIFTTDGDFERFAQHLPIVLYKPRVW